MVLNGVKEINKLLEKRKTNANAHDKIYVIHSGTGDIHREQ